MALTDPQLRHLQASDLLQLYAAGERNFDRIHLAGAQLRHANLEGIRMREADLRRVDLAGANLRGAHLLNTDLSGAKLQDAYFDDSTRFDPDFDPLGVGMCYRS
jgi:uncharacterized protein YjbI with pentapeptide repeats